jgi:serine/threonine protein kinase/WD40 repeat protein/DNA-binding winged helix-turn-helix (wHTH) protein
MQIQVLGSIEVHEDESDVALGGPTQRRMLAILALHVGDVVSVDRLIDAIWADEDLPDNPERNIRSYMHRLRSSLGDDLAPRIETVAPGYRLHLEDSELDARQFDELASRAGRLAVAGETVAALETIDEARGVWRGRPFGEFADEDWARAEVERLTETYVGLRERRGELLIRTGQAPTAVVEAEALVRELPLRERPRALLMQGLYHAGRQPEALRAFRDYREVLVEEIGVEPSKDLVALDRAIASGDLAAAEPATSSRSVGAYELHERVGEGAFAVVYRGTQAGLERDVAVKAIRAELANRPDFIRSFEAEAQLVAHLEHPHIVPLYDFWREPDSAFLVMRWLPGGTLDDSLTDGPWSLDRTTRMVEEIGSALKVAHRAGIIHRDVKPANILLDDDGNTYLTDFGIALDSEVAEPDLTIPSSSPEYASPEQLRREAVAPTADVYGLAISAYQTLTAELPFADTPDHATLIHRQLTEPIPRIAQRRTDLPAALDEVLQKATAKNARDRYQQVGDFVAAFQHAVGAASPPVQTSTRAPVSAFSGPIENPYKGLRPFGEGDADDFFGRDELIDELLLRMNQPVDSGRLLAVIGPSGSGKSSLVRAGLIPALRRGAVSGSDRWFTTTMIPGSDPFEQLETALLRVAVNPPTSLRDQLADGERGILRSSSRVLPDDSTLLLLVIDQFEELFTLCGDEELRSAFLIGLATAVTEPGSPLRVVLTLRADFYDRPLRYREFADLIKTNSVTVTPLAGDELEHAIVDPAARQGVEFEQGLVAEIIAEVGHRHGSLPLLQYSLTELFETNVSGLLLVDRYRELGGLAGALARRAEELYESGLAEQQTATRHLFGRLITLGEGNEDTRRRVLMSEMTSDVPTAAAIARFGEARLLTFDRDLTTREPTVEVAHEALIREWPRLRGWLEDDREGLRVHRHLTTSAAAWAERGRDDGDLYRGVRLDAAESWFEGSDHALNPLESQFLEASGARRDAEVLVERKRTRRLRRLFVTTAVIAVLALIAGAFAIRAQRRADNQASLATERAVDVEAARAEGDLERLRALALANAPTDPTLAALLATESYRLDPSVASLDAIHRTLTAVPGFLGTVEGNTYSDAELLDDEITYVAVGSDVVDVWDLRARELIRTIPHPATDGPATFDVSGDGRVAAVRGGTDETLLYDLTDGAVRGSIQHGAPIIDLTLSPDGGTLAAALGGSLVEIWDLGTLELQASFDVGTEEIGIAQWSPTEDRVAVVTAGSEVELWDPTRSERVWTAAPLEGADFALASVPISLLFSSNGERIVVDSGVVNGQVRVFDSRDGSQPFAPTRVARTGGTGSGDSMFWVDQDALIVGVNGFGTGTRNFDLTSGDAGPLLVDDLLGTDTAFSTVLDQVISTGGPPGFHFWSLNGAGPLERVVPFTTAQREALAENGGNIYTALSPDGSRLLTSVLALPDIVPSTNADLTSDLVTVEEFEPSIVQGFGPVTMQVTAAGFQLLDPTLAPLGPPVPFPGPEFNWYGSPDGRFYAIEDAAGGVVDLYRATGDHIASIESEGSVVSFSADGQLLQVDETLWSTDPLKRLDVDIVFDPDVFGLLIGDWILVKQEDGSLMRFDPLTQDPVGVALIGNPGGSGVYAFDGANGRLANLGESVKVWDLETGQQLGRELPGRFFNIDYTADGTVLSVSTDDRVTLWNYDTDTWPDIACNLAGRNLTEDEWIQLGPRTIERRATCPQFPLL